MHRGRSALSTYVGSFSERDTELLEFAANHRLIAREHVQALLGIGPAGATRRLRALADGGLIRYEQPFDRGPGWWRITRKGLRAIESELAPPRPDLGAWRHDLGLAWLHLAARDGAFGELDEVLPERLIRSRDATRAADRQYGGRLGVALGGYGPDGRERIHYPDLLLVAPSGHRIAVELELSRKSRDRRRSIMLGYARDRRVDAVLYLVESPSMARSIRTAAAEFGISPKVHVQYVRTPGATGAGHGPARIRGRGPSARAGGGVQR